MSRLFALLLILLALGLPGSAVASTERGFLTAGGAGSWQCFRFNSDMTTARQGVGITGAEPGTVNSVLMGWVQYINGFITAYNWVAPDMYDVAASLRPSIGINALMIVEPYCLQHPTDRFDQAILHLIDVLLPTAER